MAVASWHEGRRDGTELLAPGQSCSTRGRPALRALSPPARSRGSAGLRKGLTLGRPPAVARSDQSPVTGPVPPPTSLRLSWKPSFAGSGEQWVPPSVPGPLPSPSPTITLPSLAPPLARAQAKQGGAATPGQGGVKQRLLPGLDFLPEKTSRGCGAGGASSYFVMGRASLRVSGLYWGEGGSTQRSGHELGQWMFLPSLGTGGGVSPHTFPKFMGTRLTRILAFLSEGGKLRPREGPALLLGTGHEEDTRRSGFQSAPRTPPPASCDVLPTRTGRRPSDVPPVC